MTNFNLQDVVEQSQELTVQSRARKKEPDLGWSFALLNWRVSGAYLVAPWWSPRRDIDLRNFWRTSDHLSGAIYNMVAKMTAIPFIVKPDNENDIQEQSEAEMFFHNLMYGSQWGQGWSAFYSRFIEDLLTQDNGAFAEIIGEGPPDGPLEGMPVTIVHLDANRCQRTDSPLYPVLYQDDDGKLYKMHYTRVLYTSQMTSPAVEMNGVGFCAVSRALNVTQNLVDIMVYKQEKLGSRPHRQVIVTKGGIDPDDLATAFQLADMQMDNQGLSRYAKTVIIGDQSIPDGDISTYELSGLPDGFDEEKSTIMGMAIIALALGVDARELFPAMGSGATRADALLQHIKQRGKGPGQIIQTVESLFKGKYLPGHLTMLFELQDDAEDRQAAEISGIRAQRRERDMVAKLTTVRTEQQRMLEEGEITRPQYLVMQLENGFLENGLPVMTLFYSNKQPYKRLLDLGMDEPTNVSKWEPEDIFEAIEKARSDVYQENPSNDNEVMQVLECLAALDALEKKVQKSRMMLPAEDEEGENEDEESGDMPRGMEGDRMRREDLTSPNQSQELDGRDTLRPGSDDKESRFARFEMALERFEKVLESYG